MTAPPTRPFAPGPLRPADPWFAVEWLPGGIVRIWEPHMSRLLRANMFLIAGRDRHLLVDAGMGVASLRTFLGPLLDRPVTLLLTHAHVDHVGSAAEFADDIIMHPAEADLLMTSPDWSLTFDMATEDRKRSPGGRLRDGGIADRGASSRRLRPCQVVHRAGARHCHDRRGGPDRARRPGLHGPASAGPHSRTHCAARGGHRRHHRRRRDLRRPHHRHAAGKRPHGLRRHDGAFEDARRADGAWRPSRKLRRSKARCNHRCLPLEWRVLTSTQRCIVDASTALVAWRLGGAALAAGRQSWSLARHEPNSRRRMTLSPVLRHPRCRFAG